MMELSFSANIRDLEIALSKERAYSRQLYEYVGRLTKAYQELQKAEVSLRNEVAAVRGRDTESDARRRKLELELEQVRTELARYRRAWSDILLREKEAESVITESQRIRARIEELEAENRTLYQQQATEQARIDQERRRLEDHYRAELQNALIRLHNTEARFNDLSRELQTLETTREREARDAKNREDALRWEMQNQVLAERERVQRASEEVARKAKQEFERESEHLRAEFSRALDEERRLAAEGLEKALRAQDESAEEKLRAQAQVSDDKLRAQAHASDEKLRAQAQASDDKLRAQSDAAAEALNRLQAEKAAVEGDLRRTRTLIELKENEIRRVREQAARDLDAAVDATRADGARKLARALEDAEAEREQEVAVAHAEGSRRIARVEESLKAAEAEIRVLREERSSLEAARSALAAKAAELEARLQGALEDSREANEESARRIALQEAKYTALDARRAATEARLAAAEEKIAATESRIASSEEKLAASEKALGEARNRQDELSAALSASEGRLIEAAAQASANAAESAAKLAASESRNADLQRRAGELEARIQELQDRLDGKETDFQLLCETLVKAQTAQADAEKNADQRTQAAVEAYAEVKTREERITALTGECELLRKVLGAEKQRMREILLQLKYELKARKTGIELSPEALEQLLGESEIPLILSTAADSARSN